MHRLNYLQRAGLIILLAVSLGGCPAMRAYDGEHRSRDDVARIVSDWRLSAGAPISVFLRRVDDMDVNFQYSAVDVVPGKHHLLVDCIVNTTKHISRHSLDVEVYEGRYRLIADTQTGNRECGEVRLEKTN